MSILSLKFLLVVSAHTLIDLVLLFKSLYVDRGRLVTLGARLGRLLEILLRSTLTAQQVRTGKLRRGWRSRVIIGIPRVDPLGCL